MATEPADSVVVERTQDGGVEWGHGASLSDDDVVSTSVLTSK
jgi:hypothetical protein